MGPDALISITATSSNMEEDFVTVTITGTDGARDLKIRGKMTMEDFGRMLLGQGFRPIEITDLLVGT